MFIQIYTYYDFFYFRSKFEIYSYLWSEDPYESFETFLVENEPKEEVKNDNEEEEYVLPLD